MRVALDTNVLVYAEGVNDPERGRQANDLVEELPAEGLIIPAQVLGELFRVLIGKARWPPAGARSVVDEWRASCMVAPTTATTLTAALDLATDHGLQIWDAVIVNVAAEAGCRLLLSEDMRPGFVWRGLTVVNPFTPERHPLLAAALGR